VKHSRLGNGDHRVAVNDSAFAIRDAFPVSLGHTLVIPKRWIVSFFDLSQTEWLDMVALLAQVRRDLQRDFKPDAFNIGINDGEAAGQSVAHAHIHIIPRYAGDHPNPRGGIRCVIPGKADY
jgi:diadenosine tetraphosphate (Ap4A) HIT family hydrolase